MGGLDKLKAIKSIHSKSVGHFYLLEQSERPEGPWLVIYQETEEWRDVEHGNIRRHYKQNGVFTSDVTEIVAGIVFLELAQSVPDAAVGEHDF